MRTTPAARSAPGGTAARGARSSRMPRLVLVGTRRRRASTPASTVAPTPRFATSSRSGAEAAALRMKSRYVASSKSKNRWTFPGLRAVASQMQASWAYRPADMRDLLALDSRFQEAHDLGGHVDAGHRRQGAPARHRVDLQDKPLPARPGQQIDAGDGDADG